MTRARGHASQTTSRRYLEVTAGAESPTTSRGYLEVTAGAGAGADR